MGDKIISWAVNNFDHYTVNTLLCKLIRRKARENKIEIITFLKSCIEIIDKEY